MTLPDAYPHEVRAIKRLWAKGETFKDRGLVLTVRGRGARDKMTLPLEPERVKTEWVSSRSTNPYTKIKEFAIALGMTEPSFLSWFEFAAPDHFEELLEQLKGVDQPRERDSQAVVQWLAVRTKPARSKKEPNAHIDWSIFDQVFKQGRCPFKTAYLAAGGRNPAPTLDFQAEATSRGYDLDAEPMTASEAPWTRSVRAFIWIEATTQAPMAEVCAAVGEHQVTMVHRLSKMHLRRYSDRERVREMIRRWSEGASAEEIAGEFDVSPKTIENRVTSCAPRSCDNLKVT